MKVVKKVNYLNINFNFFFSFKTGLFYLKSLIGNSFIRMPFFFFYKEKPVISLLFVKRFLFLSFYKHLLFFYKSLFKFNFARLRLKGLGFRIKKITKNLFRFFFNLSNFFYFYVPQNLLFSVKRKRFLLISNNLDLLKKVLAHLLLLKKLSVYRTRGFVYPRQIIQLKIGKKKPI
jgi:hypothetical protein